ncbi:MAG: hypothetical protein JWN62_4120 [Acidimicrobiales bacterium]|nr:hypothetical protein [Acidimicrobiales bacterium]
MASEVTAEEIAKLHGTSPFAQAFDEFRRHWSEEHCDPNDLALLKAVRSWWWGPGIAMTEIDYLTSVLGRAPSQTELEATFERETAIFNGAHEAWFASDERASIVEPLDADRPE